MKKICIIIISLLLVQLVSAVPAMSGWFTVIQSDGTSLKVMLCGDEKFHYYVTEDNIPLMRENNGDYCYASVTGFTVSSSGVVAHEAPLRTSVDRANMSSLSNILEVRQFTPKMSSQLINGVSDISRYNNTKVRAFSDGRPKRGLVILASFSDKDFISTDANSVWSDILNKEGYSEHGAVGSVRDYFYAQSEGQFNLTFDVIGPIKMSKSCYYYGNNSAFMDDENVGELVAEACQAVADSVNFSDYDWDGDGVAEQVFILYAGYGENYTGNDSRLIWPHEFFLSAYPKYSGLKIDGVQIETYACSSELLGRESSSTKSLSGLGTFCHEFSHCLGLPDLYITSNSSSAPDLLYSWDVMSGGSYNGYGWCPPNYNSYEKYFCGWKTPIRLDVPVTIKDMASVDSGGPSYMIVNNCPDDALTPSNDPIDEYYLLENRQQDGWDKLTAGKGMLVFHVDYDKNTWQYNVVNNTKGHQRMTIVPANNATSSSTSNNFTYPYLTKDSLTNTSVPAATVFNKNVDGTYFLNKPITNIKVNNALVSFDFMGGDAANAIEDIVNDVATDKKSFIGERVSIYDISGKEVLKTNSFTGDENLSSGLYIIKGEKNKILKVSY